MPDVHRAGRAAARHGTVNSVLRPPGRAGARTPAPRPRNKELPS
ncbi:hypothetical protein ABZ733_04065 [Streptomyces longwoodensis]